MNDLRVELRFKNAALLRIIEQDFKDVSEAASMIGVEKQWLYSVIGLKVNPYQRFRKIAKSATILSDYFGLPVEVLFPPALYEERFKRKIIRDIDSHHFLSLSHKAVMGIEAPETTDLAASIDSAIDQLPERLARIIKSRFGIEGKEQTLAEIGASEGVTVEWVRKMEARALRMLRHPSRSKPLERLLGRDT